MPLVGPELPRLPTLQSRRVKPVGEYFTHKITYLQGTRKHGDYVGVIHTAVHICSIPSCHSVHRSSGNPGLGRKLYNPPHHL